MGYLSLAISVIGFLIACYFFSIDSKKKEFRNSLFLDIMMIQLGIIVTSLFNNSKSLFFLVLSSIILSVLTAKLPSERDQSR